MACNKDEAVRAKGIAENKLLERDIVGAKKFALKAQSLFAELDGLSQFLEIIDVYVAHEKKINGVSDYYGILGVHPFSDTEYIKKQYKRMALFLHPDKNKSVGAAGAFQLMSEAWGVLSDKVQRSEYDLKLNIRSSNQDASVSTSNAYTAPATDPRHVATGSNFQQSPVTSMHFQTMYGTRLPRNTAPPSVNSSQVHNFQNDTHPAFPAQCIPTPSPPFSYSNGPSSSRQQMSSPPFSSSNGPSSSRQQMPRPPFANSNGPSRQPMASSTGFFRPDTFWTLCDRCIVQYEYTIIFLNQTLLCRRCLHPFLATAIPNPPVHNRSSHPRPFPNQQQQNMPAAAPPSAPSTSQAPLSNTSKKHAKRRHEMPINMERENYPPSVPEKVETASASYTVSPGLNKERPVKRRRKDGKKCDDHKEGSQGTAGCGVYMKKASADVKGKFAAKQSKSTRELSQRNIRAMLIGKAKTEIHHQLNEWEKQKVTSSILNVQDMGNVVQDMGNVVHALSNNSSIYPETKNEPKLEPWKSSTVKETVVEAKS